MSEHCISCLRDDCEGRCCTRCYAARGVRYDGWGDGGTWCQGCLDEVHDQHVRQAALVAFAQGLVVAFATRDAAIEGGWRQHCPECNADGVHACKMSCSTRLHVAERCVGCGAYRTPLRLHSGRCHFCVSAEAER